MFDFSALPLTPDNARAARNYLGFSQAKAAEESGLPSHKIKRFEAGNYIPDEAFLNDLRGFFEARGYQFQDTQKPGAKAKGSGQVFPAGVVGETAENQGVPRVSSPQRASFHHMRIAITDEAAMGRILDLIDENEEKAQELLSQPVESGLFGGLTDTCQGRHGEALALLAENGRLFGMLFGRKVGGDPRPGLLDGSERPATHADLMHKRQADASRFALAGAADAKARKKSRKTPETLFAAIFG
ncbi:conserved hypothetical protein [Rubrivivax sp. A210]|uniref:helix-turn-helix domain-containing protein n=1 Tax=Rubrivivax sp. A210 TaxID=2772301 RepID=UPI00191A1EF7|nr:hypothetical protein [Rubrivivax sp. A210]CAD5374692.1 conserved hypothetical protein [Rubrivivax sp. A210]